jgi:hypothetical protein
MSTGIDSLVDELERSYIEAQERMNDPGLYADRNAAAQASSPSRRSGSRRS